MKIDSHVKTWYGLVATVGTVGTFSQMPGTLGTLVACLLLMVAGGIPLWALALVALLGTAAADRYAKKAGKEDPGEVVIDEVAGYWVSMVGLDPRYAIVAFFLFRIIDIVKPFPVRNMEKLPGGLGIMADDICGGVLVNVLLRFIHWLFFEGGLLMIMNAFGGGR